MKRITILIYFLLCTVLHTQAQQILSPEKFLGYSLGEYFTPHHRVVAYFQYIASVSKQVKLKEYGKTEEGRPLLAAFIANTENLVRLEDIRTSNLKLAGLSKSAGLTDQPVIVWLSYNVHGNESVSTEAAMLTLYDLVNPDNTKTQSWLKNTVVVIDPCMNPDGRERYVNFYNPIQNKIPDPLRFTREHAEPWPSGRPNHYYFDLNRDWAWQTQIETQQRVTLYNQWLPQIHVDFHEQGIDAPYYFAPAAEPMHEDITQWQKDFQVLIGKNHARYFDERGWMYFTRERFDLLYPSYGDTYPVYNGSVGMTYEQGGIGAGLAVINAEEDTLTLKSRVEHHHTTGLSTVEMGSQHAAQLVAEFHNFFKKNILNPPGKYKSYVVKGDRPKQVEALAQLLTRNGIDFGYGASKGASGYNYFSGKTEKFTVQRNDLVISAYQPKSVLLKVLFEPETFVSDSNTYDITAWSMPYAYGVQAYASTEILKPAYASLGKKETGKLAEKPVAYIAEWNAVADVRFLAKLLKRNIKVRFSESTFQSGGKEFKPGSLIIARTSNVALGAKFDENIQQLAGESGISLQTISSGFSDKGPDLGSSKTHYLKKPKVVLVSGEGTSSQAVGQIWHFFEQQIDYPVSLVLQDDLYDFNWNLMDVLILPDGNYATLDLDKLQTWVKAGGKLIALEGAVAKLADTKQFALKSKEIAKSDKNLYEKLKVYANRERDALTENIPGAIYKVAIDTTHPLAYGYPDFYYTLKQDDRVYAYLDSGWNVGVVKQDNYISGFAGSKSKQKLKDGLLFGVQNMGRGSVVYLTDNPLFRSFWENGKLLFSNAMFMVGQ